VSIYYVQLMVITTELGNVAFDMEIDGERKYTPLNTLYNIVSM